MPLLSKRASASCPIGLRVIAVLFGTIIAIASVVQAATDTAIDCIAELDATVALATNPDHTIQSLEKRFADLEVLCPAFTQIIHNQGVLAGRDNRWPQAIAHFERALEKDKRAALTHQHLQQIFEFRAAEAYARALDTPFALTLPDFQFQRSDDRNADWQQKLPEQNTLRDVATLEYELYAWWQALQSGNAMQEHYTEDYDLEAIKLSRTNYTDKKWQDTKREIAFTERDAVVVLADDIRSHTLLLMKLVGGRWKIYQETSL